ncbi:long-chain fatty acid--CoA ligase [soil metagenome]
MLAGQMMQYPLTTNAIIDYGNRVFSHREIVSKLPDGSWHRYTYADMYKRAKKLASALLSQLGVQPGDRVATFAWNHYQHIELYYGIPGAGAVCHPVNLRLSVEQIAYIINHAEDKIIFLDASLVPLFEKVAPLTPNLEKCILLNAPADFKTSLPGVIHYEDLLATASAKFDWVPVDEDDACAMCYTSGTTGEPKGALYSHRSTYLHALSTMSPNAANISSKDRVLLVSPQFHVMGWGFPFICLMAGADMIMPSMHLQPGALIEIMQQEKVTLANGVPTIWLGIYEEMKKNPPKEKLALKEYVVGGSALPAGLIDKFEKDFGCQGMHAWGMTETSPVVTASRLQPMHETLSHEEKIKIRAKQGIEIPGVEMRVVMEDGSIAPRDGKTAGEFEVKGVWIISSYYKQPEGDRFTKYGWFKTGDVGTIDEYGYMQITDRTKDLIKSGGEWISSVALETTLMSHPKVKEAAVIAIPDSKWLERPLACVVCKENETLSLAELQDFLSVHFAKYQIPEHYALVNEIPKTSVGKFDKKKMRKMYGEGKLLASS